MRNPIPAALRDALDADCLRFKQARLSCVEGGFQSATDRNADRARAMAAALRWVATLPACDVFEPYPNQCQNCIARNAVIAALEQEARDG